MNNGHQEVRFSDENFSYRHFTLTHGPADLHLDNELWSALVEIARDWRVPLVSLIDTLDCNRGDRSLTRVLWHFAIAYFWSISENAKNGIAPSPFNRGIQPPEPFAFL